MTFGTPAAPGAGGDSFAYKEHLGELIVVEVLGVRLQVQTTSGLADAISANVTVIQGAEPGRRFADCLLFGTVAFNQIKDNVGQRVLVRVSQGVAQPGKNAPWVLDTNVTPDEQQQALAMLTQQSMAQPAPPGQPPAQQPYVAPPAPQGPPPGQPVYQQQPVGQPPAQQQYAAPVAQPQTY